MDSSMFESSSFLYKTDQSNKLPSHTDRGQRQEISVSPEMENIVKSLQESLRKQHDMEKFISELEKQKSELIKDQSDTKSLLKKSEQECKHLSEKVKSLQNELSHKKSLTDKCSSLERQLKEAEKTVLEIDSNLKVSESKRYRLTRQFEEQIQNSKENSKQLKAQFCCSPGELNTNSQTDIFQESNHIIAKILDNFKYPD